MNDRKCVFQKQSDFNCFGDSSARSDMTLAVTCIAIRSQTIWTRDESKWTSERDD